MRQLSIRQTPCPRTLNPLHCLERTLSNPSSRGAANCTTDLKTTNSPLDMAAMGAWVGGWVEGDTARVAGHACISKVSGAGGVLAQGPYSPAKDGRCLLPLGHTTAGMSVSMQGIQVQLRCGACAALGGRAMRPTLIRSLLVPMPAPLPETCRPRRPKCTGIAK